MLSIGHQPVWWPFHVVASHQGNPLNQAKKVNRTPVDFRYDALNWDFIKLLAQVAHYAEGRYGRAEQYTDARLEKDQGPVNHIYEHLRCYQTGEAHDHFGDPVYHLAAVAYNAMMEFYYHVNIGQHTSALRKKSA